MKLWLNHLHTSSLTSIRTYVALEDKLSFYPSVEVMMTLGITFFSTNKLGTTVLRSELPTSLECHKYQAGCSSRVKPMGNAMRTGSKMGAA